MKTTKQFNGITVTRYSYRSARVADAISAEAREEIADSPQLFPACALRAVLSVCFGQVDNHETFLIEYPDSARRGAVVRVAVTWHDGEPIVGSAVVEGSW